MIIIFSFCIDVILAVPKSSEDKVILHESISKKFILEFEICRIIFFARGTTGSPEQSCFAFTCAHQDEDSRKTVFRCHIFRCQVIKYRPDDFYPHEVSWGSNSHSVTLWDDLQVHEFTRF